jgi:Glutamine cyclotransferase
MKTAWKLPCILVVLVVVSVLVLYGIPALSTPEIPVYRYGVVHSYHHDRFAFTEGLACDRGILIEGTGLNGNSSVRQVNITTGEVIRIQTLPDRYFGEGVTVFGSEVAQQTEDSGIGFLYDRETLEPLGTFNYTTKGWGIAWDGQHLIMSDGTSTLYFIEPDTFSEVRRIDVRAGGVPVNNLNELEYVNGEIYANVWPSSLIARISPETGTVTGIIDLRGLLPGYEQEQIGWSEITGIRGDTSIPFNEEACLNGIAYDPAGEKLYVTGKLWPELFEIQIVPV